MRGEQFAWREKVVCRRFIKAPVPVMGDFSITFFVLNDCQGWARNRLLRLSHDRSGVERTIVLRCFPGGEAKKA